MELPCKMSQTIKFRLSSCFVSFWQSSR